MFDKFRMWYHKKRANYHRNMANKYPHEKDIGEVVPVAGDLNYAYRMYHIQKSQNHTDKIHAISYHQEY